METKRLALLDKEIKKEDFVFFTCTEDNEYDFDNKSLLSMSLQKLNLNDRLVVKYNNKEGLSKSYNDFLKKVRDSRNCPYVIFVHDDVLIQDCFILEKLAVAFDDYDIVGLAGNTSVNLTAEHSAWHLMSNNQPLVGEVQHINNGKIFTSRFGDTPSRAIMVDGLFMAVKQDALNHFDVWFNEKFKFHHYDLSFCLNAFHKKLKCGVFPINVVHAGLGDSMHSKEWEKSNELFKKEYGK